MTTLRFVGELPLWIGLLLSLCVCVLSWRYYARESFDLPLRLRWVLPLLRSTAFFLGIMMLTSPVLHHRQTIGELGKVKIYLDESQSMTLHDRQLPMSQKLNIAEHLGWIPKAAVDVTALKVAERIDAANRDLRRDLAARGATNAEEAFLAIVKLYETQSKSVQPELTETLQAVYQAKVLIPLAELVNHLSASPEDVLQIVEISESLANQLRLEFDQSITNQVQSGNQTLQAALILFDESSRWRRTQLALGESRLNLLQNLRENHNVELYYLFGDQAVPVHLNDESAEKNSILHEFATNTDLGTGIAATQKETTQSSTTDQSIDQQPTAIVLFTDGNHNTGPAPSQTAQLLGSQGGVYYTVAIGASAAAPDLAVLGVEAPDQVFKRNRVRGTIAIRDVLDPGVPFVVQVRQGKQILWQEQFMTQNLPERRVEFDFSLEELVDRVTPELNPDVFMHVLPLELEANIVPLPEESETANNTQRFRIAVITESFRVLVLDGRSRWETRYIRNVFERDEQWQINTVIAGPGTAALSMPRGDQASQFPVNREDLFQYDLIVFGELSPDLFNPHELLWLREFVETRGGGMIFIDGQRKLLQQYGNTALGALIPIEWRTDVAVSQTSSLKLTDLGAQRVAFKLAVDDGQNRQFWTELPAPHTFVPVQALPGAEVLVEALVGDAAYPMLCTQRFGGGRVLYQAFDESWRWRYKSEDIWHQRIWNQLTQFVMPRSFAVSDEFLSIDTGSVAYETGDSVEIRIKLMGLDGKPTSTPTVDALLWKNGKVQSTVPLSADSEVPGIYRGETGSLRSGEYEVSIRAAGYSEAALQARSQFEILPAKSAELSTIAANHSLLEQLAEVSHGVALTEAELSRLPELLRPLSNGRVVESETVIWQSYWWFMMIIGLLTLEWLLRKRAGLL